MEEPDDEECFPFWHQYKSTFGKLYLRALSVPASSAAVERVFSRGGIIIIIIIKQENDYSDVRQLIAVARALYKIKLKTHMLIVQ